jgi:branched-chain amino acid transport system ATP-binding protein
LETTATTIPTIADRILNVQNVLDGSLIGFLLLTVVMFGFGALMMGRALAETWRPIWQNVVYGLLLGVANRLFHNFFLADDVLNLPSYVVQTAVLIGIALIAYRITQAQKMVAQYPWLYQRTGLFSWKELS